MTSVRPRPLPPSRECDARGGRRTVVAVGDVEASHRVECVRQALDGPRVADHPQRMAHVVGICGVRVRRVARGLRKNGVHLWGFGIRRHHRPRLRVERVDLPNAVVFFLWRRQFVPSDAVRGVVRERSYPDNARPRVLALRHAVGVVARRRVPDEHALLHHAGQARRAGRVHGLRIWVGAGREADFRAGDMQEAPRLAGGASPRLVARDHIVRRRDHIGRAAWRRAQPAERAKQGGRSAQAKITTLNAVLEFQGSTGTCVKCTAGSPTRTINNPSTPPPTLPQRSGGKATVTAQQSRLRVTAITANVCDRNHGDRL